MHNNPFDSMGGIIDPEELVRQKAADAELWNSLEQRIHKVFAQNDTGKELLEIWKEALIMNPTVTPHSTQFQAGIEEGKKEFIRNIYLTIKKVEGS